MWCEHDVRPTPHSGTLGWWVVSAALVHAEAFGRWSDIVTRAEACDGTGGFTEGDGRSPHVLRSPAGPHEDLCPAVEMSSLY